jgi:hypothetical protein
MSPDLIAVGGRRAGAPTAVRLGDPARAGLTVATPLSTIWVAAMRTAM